MVINYNGDVYPCCTYRLDMINDVEKCGDKIKMGNIFDDGFEQVWNSNKYYMAREIVQRSKAIKKDEIINHFCYGCEVLYERKKIIKVQHK